MTVIEKIGNVFTSDADYVGHGVNIYGIMGAGIAVQVRNKFPEVYERYVEACAAGELIPGGCLSVQDPATGVVISNLATQDKPGANARLEWLESSLSGLLEVLSESDGDVKLALPQIASNIGGLEWVDVRELIISLAEQYPKVTVELWTYDGS